MSARIVERLNLTRINGSGIIGCAADVQKGIKHLKRVLIGLRDVGGVVIYYRSMDAQQPLIVLLVE